MKWQFVWNLLKRKWRRKTVKTVHQQQQQQHQQDQRQIQRIKTIIHADNVIQYARLIIFMIVFFFFFVLFVLLLLYLALCLSVHLIIHISVKSQYYAIDKTFVCALKSLSILLLLCFFSIFLLLIFDSISKIRSKFFWSVDISSQWISHEKFSWE